MLHVTKFIFGVMHPLKKQFEFVTSINIKGSTNCRHLKCKFWNYICLDRMFLDEENKRLSVRLKKKKRGRGREGGEGEYVLFMSTLLLFLTLVAGELWTPGGPILFLMQDQAWAQSMCSASCSALYQLCCRFVNKADWCQGGRAGAPFLNVLTELVG